MALRRCDIFDASNPGVYHCISRCVRREPLLSIPTRRNWLVQRLEHLAKHAGIDVLAFAIMSNHLHLLLRNRPDVVAKWSDREVALRRIALLPNRRARVRRGESPEAPPTEQEIHALIACPRQMRRARTELSDLGFFHRLLKEPCARAWNREDGVTGHFWEGRFLSPPVLDAAALVRVARYIELNEIRAQTAQSIPRSRWTSARTQWERLRNELRRLSACSSRWPAEALARVKWSPVFRCDATDPVGSSAPAVEMPLIDYIATLDSAGRRGHPAKPGRITTNTAAVLQAAREAGGRGGVAVRLASKRMLAEVSARLAALFGLNESIAAALDSRWRSERDFGSCHADSDASAAVEARRRGVARVIPMLVIE